MDATLNPARAFAAPYAEDDALLARKLLAETSFDPVRKQKVDALARDLIEAIRAGSRGLGGIEDMLHEYALTTREGLALMVLAEALLRVPDSATADRLIEDKLGQADFAHHETRSGVFLVNASAWALGITARVIQPGETPEGILRQMTKRLGVPTVRTATRQAMRVMGNHFVLGQTIEEALKRAQSAKGRVYRYSFDMLGEGARTAKDAQKYFDSYAHAIDAIGRIAGNRKLPERPGISVKLSALHPRYEALNHAQVLEDLTPRVRELARKARSFDLNFTIDAEEADRLELSLDVIEAVMADPELAGWEGFGLAIQAYQKRARAVIDHVAELAERFDRKLMVRLVKGAYWDTEVKRGQERGLDDYPVFTRKAMTDLNFIACAERMLELRPRIFPQFATHNALTVAQIIERAGDDQGYEFQRLHGMGEQLYGHLLETDPGIGCRIYAPVGGHSDLLAYLVRRLLENGANSSFVSVAADPSVAIEELLKRPDEIIGSPQNARHSKLPLPRDLYGTQRRNSRGVEFGSREAVRALAGEMESAGRKPAEAVSIIDGNRQTGETRQCLSPNDGRGSVGTVIEAGEGRIEAQAEAAVKAARAGFRAWDATPVETRAKALERFADLMEERRARLLALLQSEAGKTIDDALAELREAVDFCRYYAIEARRHYGPLQDLPGPTGESNRFGMRGRGVFVAISPWNFPLAIFTGQIVAALVSGNTVIAKPAEQTPLVAAETVALMHEAGIPASALHILMGDGRLGAELVAHPRIDGVVFTGSTEVARAINLTLAQKNGPITPLIAETGGINAMIVDATALPEQVADDVVMSAFRSAGQRCSALRLLFVQEDVADRMIAMIAGAARELRLGDPRDFAVHVGPVIDAEAKERLEAHIATMKREAKAVHFAGTAPAQGSFVAPHMFELARAEELTEEVFGPILHVVRYRAADLDKVLDTIEAKGYGLTLGLHTRIEATVEKVVRRLAIGNVYANRNMIGAVVGVQPFGGNGLSGTGPKAGGPHYLPRFGLEQTVSINTAAAGGNAALIAMEE